MVAIVFGCIIVHFPSKPKHPPSITSAMERTAFLPSLRSICTNPQVIMTFKESYVPIYHKNKILIL